MWVLLKPDDKPGTDICLPGHSLPLSGDQVVSLRYGTHYAPVRVRVRTEVGRTDLGHSPDYPATVVISPDIMSYLSIRPEPVYQLHFRNGALDLGPVLGLLLGNRNHWYDHAYLDRDRERVVNVYQRTGGLFCAFSPRNVSLSRRCAFGLFYNPSIQKWEYGEVPLPRALHRRSFHSDQSAVERLMYATGSYLFNTKRFDKWELHEILSRSTRFTKHLPETARAASPEAVFRLLKRHGTVVLKPSDLSRGRGILFIEQSADFFHVADCRTQGITEQRSVTRDELTLFLQTEIVPRPYLCQQRIDMATIEGAPFDIRVVMQRNTSGQWQCTGIECRQAGPGGMVTNIAFGGRALRIEEAIGASFGDQMNPQVAEGTVIGVSMDLCDLMDETGEVFVELGIDVALDRSGHAWLIEANMLPTFKGFKSIDPDTYRRILEMPLLHASYVTGFREHSDDDNRPETGGDADEAIVPR